ncbi:MAG: hypothetical protein J6C85_08170 [Alphaproteobacteria bacterium]|nr:hypothetical protein [Alphaproteobacteria bacterium]
MKSHIKDILLLGGIYFIGSTVLAFFPTLNIADTIWLLLAVIALIILIFKKRLSFLEKLKNTLPRLSFFLTAIGWLPYVATSVSFLLLAIHLIFTNQIPLYLLQNIYIISEYIYAALFLLSLIYAAYRVFYKKEY